MRLIVTRPEPDASRTAEALVRLGHEPILSPMLDIRFGSAATIPDRPFQAVLVTSRNAVRAVSAKPGALPFAGLPLLAVGDGTALEAKRAGFRHARSAGGAVADLVALAGRDLAPSAGPLLLLCGDVQAGDLPALLEGRGFAVEPVVVYRSEPRGQLSEAARAALSAGEAGGVLLYSPRSAAAFARALAVAGLAPLPDNVACVCLSPAVADELAGMTHGPVLVAPRPDQISLLGLVDDLARNAPGAEVR